MAEALPSVSCSGGLHRAMDRGTAEHIHRSGQLMLELIRDNRADCTSCGGSGTNALWVFEWKCGHCDGEGIEPLKKIRRNGTPYIDLKNGVDV